MANISAIKLPDNTTYNIRAGAIPYGEVDSTSTSTAFTATVPGINELVDGTIMMLHNGVVTSASGFKININGLGAKKCYNNLTNATQDTTIFNVAYTMVFIYSESLDSGKGGWWLYRGYDANTNTIGYQLRGNNGTRPAADKGYKYRLWLSSLDNQSWVPINTSTATDATTSRSLNSRVIDPFGEIVYYAYNGTTNAAENLTATTIWQQYTLTIGYSYVKSLTAWDPVYLKCEPQTSGGAIMKDIVQALPTTADGFIYIYLGIAYSATAMELRFYHPVYYHDGTGIKVWTGTKIPTKVSELTNDSGYTSFSGSYNDLTDKPTIPVLPSNIVNTVTTTAGAHTVITNKTGNVSFNVPTKTSHLTNDSGFLTSETDPTVHAWAKAETKPSYTFSEIGSKPTTISGYGITDAYTKTQVDGLVAGVLHYKGTKASVANLPTSDNVIGDVWHITADGSEYAWDGSVWQELGTAIDLSGYATKATTLAGYGISDAKIENGTITLGSNSITPLTSETDPVFSASAAASITSTDISNWNAKVSDTKTWGDVVAPSGRADTSDSRYIPQFSSTSSSSTTTATFTITRVEPFRLGVPKWDLNNYLYAATPSANDNSTKVATTAFVQSAIPTIPTNVSAFTNDAGYITVADLPEPLIGSTSNITPTQVLTALRAGRDIYLSHAIDVDMSIVATYFDYAPIVGMLVSNIIVFFQGEYYSYALVGMTSDDTWTTNVTALAQKLDIPTTALSSTTGITASTTATKTTLGTADSVIGVQSSTTTASKVTLSGSNSFSASVSNHVLSFSHGAQTVSASDVTVPIKDTSAKSIPNVSVASATVSITDPGHTHQLSN